jgi:large subunit ribosomal protein L3
MTPQLMGKKLGMRLLFTEEGKVVAVTAIAIEPNLVVQVKNNEKDGYNALVLGSQKIIVKDSRTLEKRMKKPQLAMFQNKEMEPRRHLAEARLEDVSSYSEGQELGLSLYADIKEVDVTGVSKGKGYQGVMKKYGFSGGPAAHGSGFHRHAGSTGMRSTPGHCFKGDPRASHMGSNTRTAQNVKVFMCISEDNVLLVIGSIPGATGELVYVNPAIKKQKNQTLHKRGV